jgi:hypothetical protein
MVQLIRIMAMKCRVFIFGMILSSGLIGMNEQELVYHDLLTYHVTAQGIPYYLFRGQRYPVVPSECFYPLAWGVEFEQNAPQSSEDYFQESFNGQSFDQESRPPIPLSTLDKITWPGLVHVVRPVLKKPGKMLNDNGMPRQWFLDMVSEKQDELCTTPDGATILAHIGNRLMHDYERRVPFHTLGMNFLRRALKSKLIAAEDACGFSKKLREETR